MSNLYNNAQSDKINNMLAQIDNTLKKVDDIFAKINKPETTVNVFETSEPIGYNYYAPPSYAQLAYVKSKKYVSNDSDCLKCIQCLNKVTKFDKETVWIKLTQQPSLKFRSCILNLLKEPYNEVKDTNVGYKNLVRKIHSIPENNIDNIVSNNLSICLDACDLIETEFGNNDDVIKLINEYYAEFSESCDNTTKYCELREQIMHASENFKSYIITLIKELSPQITIAKGNNIYSDFEINYNLNYNLDEFNIIQLKNCMLKDSAIDWLSSPKVSHLFDSSDNIQEIYINSITSEFITFKNVVDECNSNWPYPLPPLPSFLSIR